LCILPCTSGIGNTSACPSSPTHSRALQTRACVARWPECIDFGIAPLRLPRRVAIFVYGAFSITPPWWPPLVCPRLSCAATSSSSTSTALRWPRLSYAQHLRPCLLALQVGYLDIGTKGYYPHELLADFPSSRSIHTTPTLRLRGRVSPLAPAFDFSSLCLRCSRCDCGGVLVYPGEPCPKSCTLIYTGPRPQCNKSIHYTHLSSLLQA